MGICQRRVGQSGAQGARAVIVLIPDGGIGVMKQCTGEMVSLPQITTMARRQTCAVVRS